MFIDEINLVVEPGSGGKGCESYAVRSDRKRVPDGGDGGKGGDIIFRADQNVVDLDELRYRKNIRAPAGEPGGPNNRTGRSSQPVIVKVPCGTLIMDQQNDLRIRDLKVHGEEVVVAEGGRGGGGNQHGQMRASEKGIVVQVSLVIRLVTDVVLLGFPNSGKSLLLSKLTHAQPKSELYPFSTQAPQLGTLEVSDYKQIKICELPGLLEGSHAGKGIGNKFLRHLNHTKLLVLVLDPYNSYSATVSQNYKILIEELRRYNESTLNIPRLIVINKADQPGFKERVKNFHPNNGEKVLIISSSRDDGLEKLKQELEIRAA